MRRQTGQRRSRCARAADRRRGPFEPSDYLHTGLAPSRLAETLSSRKHLTGQPEDTHPSPPPSRNTKRRAPDRWLLLRSPFIYFHAIPNPEVISGTFWKSLKERRLKIPLHITFQRLSSPCSQGLVSVPIRTRLPNTVLPHGNVPGNATCWSASCWGPAGPLPAGACGEASTLLRLPENHPHPDSDSDPRAWAPRAWPAEQPAQVGRQRDPRGTAEGPSRDTEAFAHRHGGAPGCPCFWQTPLTSLLRHPG